MTGPLVSTAWVADRLRSGNLALLDASWHMPAAGRDPRAEFIACHIPGAAFFDIDRVADPTTNLPHMLPTPEAFSSAMRALGVSSESRVVVYDSHGVLTAPRAWWSLRAMGHQHVAVLDGGLRLWRSEGRPVESGEAKPGAGDFTAQPTPDLVADLNAVRAALLAGTAQVADARPAARFTGAEPEPRAGLRTGHMPGALNLPWSQLVAPEGTMAAPDSLAAAFANAGIDPAGPVIATCGSGVTASLLALATACLGYERTSVYDGSWSEWGAHADLPVATG